VQPRYALPLNIHRLGAVETAKVWPCHYRLVEGVAGEAAEYVRQLEHATTVFVKED
jgi:hypothetical protein